MVHLSFRPGFSPVTPRLKKQHNRFDGLLFFCPSEMSLSKKVCDRRAGETAETVPCDSGTLTTGLKPGVNEKELLRQSLSRPLLPLCPRR